MHKHVSFAKKNPAIFCMDHFKNVRRTCNIAGHSSTVLRGFKEYQIQTNFMSSKQMSFDGFDGFGSARMNYAAISKTKIKQIPKNPRKEKCEAKKATTKDESCKE